MLKRLPSVNLHTLRKPTLSFPRSLAQGRRRWLVGAVLVGAGLLALVSQFTDVQLFGLLFLPILGLTFLLWGIGAHHEGLLVSGSVVSGLGVGVLLIEHVLAPLGAEARGGIFLLAVAGGWAAIPLFTALLRLGARWWPLLPAGVLALVGLALLLGGAVATMLALIGQLWPAALVIVGLTVLLRRERGLSASTVEPPRDTTGSQGTEPAKADPSDTSADERRPAEGATEDVLPA